LRGVVLAIVLLFIAALGLLTVLDVVRNGITVVAVAAILVLVLLGVGVVGALRQPPRE